MSEASAYQSVPNIGYGGVVFAGVYVGMLLNFSVWVAAGWSELNQQTLASDVVAVLAIAAGFAIPPTLGVMVATRWYR